MARPTRFGADIRVRSLASGVFAVWLGACASNPPPPPTVVAPRAPAVELPPGVPAPLVTTATDGLEVHWWLTDDSAGKVARALGAFLEPAQPSDEALRQRWESSGLRMVRAPIDRIADIEQSLPAIQQRRRQWVGWATQWTEVFRGRTAGGAGPIIVDGSARTLPRGTLRILARCWPAPARGGIEGPHQVRIEVVLQHVPEETPTAAAAFTEPAVRLPESEGECFAALAWEGVLEPGFIYLIAPEAPGIAWGRGTTSPKDQAAAPPDQPTPGAPTGPLASGPLTIGQAMMSFSPGEVARGSPKAVLMFLPRPPKDYRLLP